MPPQILIPRPDTGSIPMIAATFQRRANKGPLFSTSQLDTRTGLAGTAGLLMVVRLAGYSLRAETQKMED